MRSMCSPTHSSIGCRVTLDWATSVRTHKIPPMPAHRLTSETIESETALRALLGEPNAAVCAEVTNRLNPLTRIFIERSWKAKCRS